MKNHIKTILGTIYSCIAMILPFLILFVLKWREENIISPVYGGVCILTLVLSTYGFFFLAEHHRYRTRWYSPLTEKLIYRAYLEEPEKVAYTYELDYWCDYVDYLQEVIAEKKKAYHRKADQIGDKRSTTMQRR